MSRGRPRFSENWSGSKRATGESLPLDVRKLHRRGGLERNAYSSTRWWRGPDKSNGSSIGCLGGGDFVTLIYNRRGEKVEQRVTLDWTACNFGGKRPWWRCPSCARRVAVIYGAGKYFACRSCYGLCYGAQKENSDDRALRKAFKIRERLGDMDGSMFDFFPEKPKWMRWKTYWRLSMDYREAEMESWSFARKLCGME